MSTVGRARPAIELEPARGCPVYPGLTAVPGVEQLRAFLSGRAPAPAVARLTGRRIVDASPGSATYALPATGWMLGPNGFVHSGALALLADGALVAAVISGLGPRTLCTTAELSLTFLARLPAGRGDVVARGRLLHLDAEMGLADVFVHDADDRLVAHGTSRCTVFPPIDASVELRPPAPPAGPALDSPDPYRRPMAPTEISPLPPGSDGLELLRAQLRGRPPPPIDRLTAIRLVAAERGRVVFALAAHPWLGNEWGTVYGGVTALLAKSAAAAAVQTTAPADARFTALDIKVNLLRPIPLDGRDLVATGTLLHRGKRLAIATSEVVHGDQRVAVATGTTALTPTSTGPREARRRAEVGAAPPGTAPDPPR
jgi:acyl-CoA thioesterase